jgi:hypothetical protein
MLTAPQCLALLAVVQSLSLLPLWTVIFNSLWLCVALTWHDVSFPPEPYYIISTIYFLSMGFYFPCSPMGWGFGFIYSVIAMRVWSASEQ